ncbi:MAG: hypothetical protein Q7K13_11745, partial [Polynucleobacter sp.]|uniref:hypothetical protein n=1 Tax=Polynucleobacter sp. TaxID=2029855 RepID=UPI00271BBD57
ETLPKPPTASSPPLTGYHFPLGIVAPALATGMSNEERLRRLVSVWTVDRDYMAIREEYCRLSIALNNECLLAPAFRPTPKITKISGKRTAADLSLHQDQLVIDCHWLHCRREIIIAQHEEYQPIFDLDGPFPFELAAAFACKKWSKKFRSDEVLSLTAWQQFQLQALQGEAIRNRRNASGNGFGMGTGRVQSPISTVRQALREWSRKDRRIIKHQKIYEDLWLARALLSPGASINDIRHLGAMASGVVALNERTVRDKLQKLDKRMAGAM